MWVERPWGRAGSPRYRPGRAATGRIVAVNPDGRCRVRFDCGMVGGVDWCTASPLELTRLPDEPPDCPTPRKRRFRSAADAKRWWRQTYWAQGKPRLYPYRCASGEHWHLTHYTPQQQKTLVHRQRGRSA